jgi:outer membrane protein assembly factor BamB
MPGRQIAVIVVGSLVAVSVLAPPAGAGAGHPLTDTDLGAPIRWIATDEQSTALLVVPAPDESTVYVAGVDAAGWIALAYVEDSGARLWTSSLDDNFGRPAGLVVSPDGSQIFVAGHDGSNLMVVAVEAATGVVRWLKRYHGPAPYRDEAIGLVLSPDGSEVYVAGRSGGDGSRADYLTIAYNAQTGAERWMDRHDAGSGEIATGIDISPEGRRLFVTGYGYRPVYHMHTVAIATADGSELWAVDHGDPGSFASPSDIAASNGRTVYVTGGMGFAMHTVAYDGRSGREVWAADYDAGYGQIIPGLCDRGV